MELIAAIGCVWMWGWYVGQREKQLKQKGYEDKNDRYIP